MRRKFLAAAFASVSLGVASLGARAHDAVGHCVAIQDANARLACFDAAARGQLGGPTVAAPAAAAGDTVTAGPRGEPSVHAAPASTPAAASTKATDASQMAADSDFGLSTRETVTDRITATVRSVASHSIPGRWIVTLDNDQVWEQRETTAANRRPKPGDSVTIEQASFGSYMMVTAGRGSSRVKRIR